MLVIAVTIVHVIVCLFLIIVVLLQSGKAADLAGAFGGMGSQTAFGPRGAATVLTKATTTSAVLFMVTSITLSILATRSSGTGGAGVLEKVKVAVPENQFKDKTALPPGTPSMILEQNGTAGKAVPIPAEIMKQLDEQKRAAEAAEAAKKKQ
jgi:preprotein translocase subunit SecG